MNIVLLGYMGCGKSSVGKVLAAQIGMEFLDLDHFIEEKEQMTISEVFKSKGEIYFRKKETEYLKEVLATKDNLILSLGGGTPCFSGNIELIQEDENSKSYYLKTSLDTLVQRLFLEKDQRPLIAHLANTEELKDFIRKHLFERSYYYNKAEKVVETDDKTVKEIVKEIID